MLAIFTQATPDGYEVIARIEIPDEMPTAAVAAIMAELGADHVRFAVNSENEPIAR